jgi:hypothetical protein
MTQDVGEAILKAIGHDHGAKGVITTDQMPDAIAKLKALSEANPGTSQNASEDDDDEPHVSFAQRAFPFIEMLEEALAAGKDVTWGV